jgi:plastocyanin
LFVLFSSIGLFIVWNGLLWNAPREASHVGRFAVSYLAVIPIAALLLLMMRRLRLTHLITTTGTVWSIKLVVTALLYQVFARGTATNLHAIAPTRAQIVQTRGAEYRAATGAFASGVIQGKVLRAGQPVAGAVVFLDNPAPGAEAPDAQPLTLEIRGQSYEKPLFWARPGDDVKIWNHDAVLHTAHLYGKGLVPKNHPAPPSAVAQPFTLPDTGLYHVRCDNHPSESAWLLVLDHPYLTQTAADGSFSLPRVAAGQARVVAIEAGEQGAYRAEGRATVAAGQAADLTLDLADLRESSLRGEGVVQ